MANDPIRPSTPSPVRISAASAPPPATDRPAISTSSRSGNVATSEIAVYHHSTLFYWWPVWLCGFIMAAITYFDGTRMAIVPPRTTVARASSGEAQVIEHAADHGKKEDIKSVDLRDKDVLVLPTHHLTRKDTAGEAIAIQPVLFMAYQKSIGAVFVFIVLLVIVITNVHMRGLWSFFVLIVLLMFTLIAAAAGWWQTIFASLGQLSVHINMGGYILLSSILFALWLINFLVIDRQIYMIFSPGQVRMRLEIGGGETVFDTTGMVIQKQRADLFRHWILGFGSGDLIVRPVGVSNPIELPNVLHVGRKVRLLENLVKEKIILS